MGSKNDGPAWDDVWDMWAYMCTTRDIELTVRITPARRFGTLGIVPSSAFVTARWWAKKKLYEKTAVRRFRGNGGAATMPAAIIWAMNDLQAALDSEGRVERYAPGELPPTDAEW